MARQILTILMLTALVMPMLIVAPGPTIASEEEECVFDQAEQKAEYIRLQKEYPGSTYIEDEFKLVIPRQGHEIVLTRGGCVHFGITVLLTLPRTDEFAAEEAFFAKILELVAEFGGDLADPKKLEQLIKEKKWADMSADTGEEGGMYYFIGYPGLTAFEVFQRHNETETTIGVSFYI